MQKHFDATVRVCYNSFFYVAPGVFDLSRHRTGVDTLLNQCTEMHLEKYKFLPQYHLIGLLKKFATIYRLPDEWHVRCLT